MKRCLFLFRVLIYFLQHSDVEYAIASDEDVSELFAVRQSCFCRFRFLTVGKNRVNTYPKI